MTRHDHVTSMCGHWIAWMGPTNRRGYCLPKYHHHDLHHLHHFNCECTTRGSCIRVLSKTTTHAGRSTPHSGQRSRGTAIHRAATQVGDHRNRHTVTFSNNAAQAAGGRWWYSSGQAKEPTRSSDTVDGTNAGACTGDCHHHCRCRYSR